MGVEVLKDESDKVQFDASKVDGLDPNYHYRWARIEPGQDPDLDRNLSARILDGYEVVERDQEKSLLTDTTRVKMGKQLDNTIRWGRDMILVRTPKENYERRVRQEQARTARQTQGVARAYKEAIRKATGENLAYEEHRDPKGSGNRPAYNTSATSAEAEEMSPEQMREAMKLAGVKVDED